MTDTREQQALQDMLRALSNELMAIRGNAQLLIRRLEHQAGGLEINTDACQTIIEQTQHIEIALSRLAATSPHLLCGNAAPNPDPECAHLDLPPPSGQPAGMIQQR